MKSLQTLSGVSAITVLSIAAGCSSWNWDRMGQSNKTTPVASSSGTASRDTTNSAGANTSGQVALGWQSGSMNPPGTYATSQSVAGASPSYSRPRDVSGSTATSSMNTSPSTATSGMSAGTNAASAPESTQRSASVNPSRSNMGASGTSRMSTRGTTGSNHGLVRSAQRALNAQGYSAGAVDGIMGPHTQAAIRKFQSAKGLQATGQLDAATIAALGVTQPAESSTMG
jgi:hypothetical protein